MSVCRACLVTDVKMFSLENHIMEMYCKLTNIESAGPRAVCYICHSLLRRCHRFAEMARCSEETLQDMLHRGIEASHKNILKLNPTIWGSLSASPTHNCDYTQDACSHIKEEIVPSGEEMFIKEEFIKEEPIVTEVDFPVTVTQENKKQEDIKQKSIFACNKCGESFSAIKKLSAHIQDHKKVIFICSICNNKFTCKYLIKNHLINTHNKKQSQLSAYLRIQYPENEESTDSNKSNIINYSDNRPYVCEVCGKGYIRKLCLATHVKTHTGEKPYACDVCRKKFSAKYYLTEHMRVHTGEKPFVCDVCNKFFSRKYFLTVHMRTHKRKP